MSVILNNENGVTLTSNPLFVRSNHEILTELCVRSYILHLVKRVFLIICIINFLVICDLPHTQV